MMTAALITLASIGLYLTLGTLTAAAARVVATNPKNRFVYYHNGSYNNSRYHPSTCPVSPEDVEAHHSKIVLAWPVYAAWAVGILFKRLGSALGLLGRISRRIAAPALTDNDTEET